ncbi:hypothetical protein [Paraglaciecola marina]|uniref:hypothetical protein n=1 Tax=Paraglaciecola marina TaxID=2500157 RepID=UPI00105F0B19|nr:hypothetical protein [Paraglaciecola marina]
MYQKTIKLSPSHLINKEKTKGNISSIFDRKGYAPLDFTPLKEESDATYMARDILSSRTNAAVIRIAHSIDWMKAIGSHFAFELAKMQLKDSQRQSFYLTDGRCIYLLLNYFDLTTINVKKLRWCEVFATLVLMHSASIKSMTHDMTLKAGESELSKALKENIPHVIAECRSEILDSMARAECLFDEREQVTSSGKAGGSAKAERIMPLKVEVIQRYLKDCTSFSNKKAGTIIEAELNSEASPLLVLSDAEEKNLQFSKWIGAFKKGKLILPIP